MVDRNPVLSTKNETTTWLNKWRQNPVLREGGALLVLYWTYSFVRWFVAQDGPYEAYQNAFRIIQLEQQLGIFFERTIQDGLISHAPGVVHFANSFYTVGYFPVLIAAAVLLYRYDKGRFQVFKLTFLLGLGFALVGYLLFPLAPPRMVPEVGFVDTQRVYGSDLYNQKSVISFYNPYAAMPSLHFGWALLVGMMAYTFDRRIFKVLGVLYPACMALVIVTTGHHYVLDIAGGGVVVGLAYVLVQMLFQAGRVQAPIVVGRYNDAAYADNRAKNRAGLAAALSVPYSKRSLRRASTSGCDGLPPRGRLGV